MTDNRKSKAGASKVDNGKKTEADQRGGVLRRAAKALEKASAREKKVQGNVDKGSSQLDAALLALEKADVGSPNAREVEAAARAALKALLGQRKKLRKARKALRRAEAKERKAKEGTAAAAATKSRLKKPAAQIRKASRKRPARKRPAEARAKNAGTKPRVTDTMPTSKSVRGAAAGGFPESAGALPVSAPHRELK